MVEVNNFTAGYGKKPVLQGCTARFRPGRLTALVGKNGCGKTTLLKALDGLVKGRGGEILLQGRPLAHYRGRQLAQTVSYLPQSRPLPDIPAGRLVLHGRFPYLGYPRQYTKQDLALAHQALERVGAGELEHTLLPQLSGGQRQKVYLALLLAQDTPVVLMDEPTTYLDVSGQLETMALARELARQGKTVVMVIHDLCLALEWADELLVLEKGRAAAQAAPKELLAAGVLEQAMGISIGQVEAGGRTRYYYL